MDTTRCKYCDAPTRHTATRQCDNCWEVSSRIKDMPIKVLEHIIATERVEFLTYTIKRSYEQGVRDQESRARSVPGQGDMGG